MSGGYNSSPGTAAMTSMSSESVSSLDRDESGLGSMPIIGIDYKKHEELKKMLDSNKDSLKLEAMKHAIGLVAKGRDCADLFPAIVKNVVSKNPEIKKLVYVYLVRYAEEQQDLALLSISTFQKALRDPNQLIRASALRVLSSVRVPIIAPVMMLSIKESASDMSPYVRKAAAHAIPKLFSLDPEMKESLVEIIETLLKDKTTLVAGSVVMAFESVCPERIDLVHKNYRKLVNLMADVDEWGQVIVINMLTRYARTQFIDPNTNAEDDEKFYPSEEEEEESEEDEDEEDDEEEEGEGKSRKKKKPKPYRMDPDHRLLLRNVKPLLQSRNPAVVMSVAQLYFHLAPISEQSLIVKPIVRLLKGHRETQSVVLTNIATISVQKPRIFEPHLKSFFVLTTDPTHIKMLKLEILTNIASDSTVHTVLREFRTYISFPDRQFASATVQAIGRVACSLSEVNETCLHGLMSLLSNKDDNVVGESVVVIKKLLQMQPREHKDLIRHVARMVDRLSVPRAKASVLWMLGEYSNLVPKIAPDVLRQAARDFPNEEDMVKLQVVNLAAKLVVTNPKQTTLLCQYVMNMAKYDLNYDVRDRARFLRQLVQNKVSDENEEGSALSKYAKKILLSTKPAPVLESAYKNHGQWQIGSLSHYLNSQVSGYIPLPDFPLEPSDPSVREVDEDFESFLTKSGKKNTSSFYSSEEEDTSSDDEDSEFYSDDEGDSDDESDDDDDDDDEEEDDDDDSDEEDEDDEDSSDDAANVLKNLRKTFKRPTEDDDDEDSDEEDSEEETDEEDDDSEEEEESDESEDEPAKKPTPVVKTSRSKQQQQQQQQQQSRKKSKEVKPQESNDLLLLFDDTPAGDSSSSLVTKATSILTPTSAGSVQDHASKALTVLRPGVVPSTRHELLNRVTGKGLLVTFRFMRHAHPYSNKMAAVDIEFTNTGTSPIDNIRFGSRRFQSGMEMEDPPPVARLLPGASQSANIGINFNDTIQPAKFDICYDPGLRFPVQVEPPVGELVQPVSMAEDRFRSLRDSLSGMNESEGRVAVPSGSQPGREDLQTWILGLANLAVVPTAGDAGSSSTTTVLFAGVSYAHQSPVLLSVTATGATCEVTVNCEKMTIHSMLLRDLKSLLRQS